MVINGSDTANKKDMLRCGLSLALGVTVVLWRVFLPTNVEITIGIVILVAALDMALTAALILINRAELKAAIFRKFTPKDLLRIIMWFALFLVFIFVVNSVVQAILLIYYSIPITADRVFLNHYITFDDSLAAIVGYNFFIVFPLGASISMIIAAPIWEEISFRMAGRKLIKNGIMYVLITSVLFGFIHTGSFLTWSILGYFIRGVFYCLIYLKTKDLRMAIGVHFVNNFLFGIMTLTG